MITDTLLAIKSEAESGEPDALDRIKHLVQGLLKHTKIGRDSNG